MTETTRLWMSLCAVLVTACGAGDTRLDPSDLELRDLLGLSPEVASSWDAAQRAAARHVIEAGLRQRPTAPARAVIRDGAAADAATDVAAGDAVGDAIDRRVAKALASIDIDRARHRAGALGAVAVVVVVGRSDLVATPRASTLAPRAAPPIDLQLRGWTEPALRPLPARGMDVLAALASDAGHAGGSLVVAPAPELAVVAGYLPANADGPARLVVNPVVLAVLEPRAAQEVQQVSVPQAAVSTATPSAAAPAAGAAQADDGPIGNPYSFYGSVAECAAAQQSRCDACLAHNSCTTITGRASGADECRQLAANGGRGYALICINLALAIDEVASCAASDAPACPRDIAASKSLGSLEANATFLDNAACAAPLDGCLATLYGAPGGGFPGTGSGSGGGSGRPRNTDIDCSDSCNGDTNCDSSPSCELDGPSCDAATDGECSEPDESSSCDGGSTGEGGDSCSSDGEDACGSESSNNSCDSSGGDSDCGSSGGDSDCGSSGGGESCDSGGGGGDCGGGGGDDCSGGGGGGDCNVAGKRGRPGASLPVAIAWALLPIPLAAFVRRRAERRRRALISAPISAPIADGGAP